MAAESSFQPEAPGMFSGTAQVEVRDPAGTDPARVIQTDHDWEVEVKWTIIGFAATGYAVNPNNEWNLAVFAEGIGGPGVDEKQLGSANVAFNDHTVPLPHPDEYEYSVTINVPADELAPGAYRLATILTAQDTSGPTPLQIAAFVEGPVIQQYKVTP